VDPRASLDVAAKRKVPVPAENPSSVVQSVALLTDLLVIM